MNTFDSSMLYIENSKQLFFDDYVIESGQDVTRTMHCPAKVAENPLIVRDRPWERVPYFAVTNFNVIHDTEAGLFKCWYIDWDPYWMDKVPEGTSPFTVPWERVLYAQSEDGLHWTKPELGVVRVDGSDTNILFAHEQWGTFDSITVVLSPFEPDRSRRFKMLFRTDRSGDWEARVAFSPDGIHWALSEEAPSFGIYGSHLSDVILASCEPCSRQYVANVRHWAMIPTQIGWVNPRLPRNEKSYNVPFYPNNPALANRRRVWQVESADFVHWTQPYLVAAPDRHDNIDAAFYGMPQFRMGNLRVGILNVFHMADNTLHMQLMYSRDGKNWERAGGRAPILKPGAPASWDQYMTYTGSCPFQVGDEIFIYYGGAKHHHDYWLCRDLDGPHMPEVNLDKDVGYGLGLAKIRLDGFFSIDAGTVREGLLTTHPLHSSSGRELVVNACCGPGGYIEVEVADLHDNVIEGFRRHDCDRVAADAVRRTVTWSGNEVLPACPGDYRKLRFYLRNAGLYAFQFVES